LVGLLRKSDYGHLVRSFSSSSYSYCPQTTGQSVSSSLSLATAPQYPTRSNPVTSELGLRATHSTTMACPPARRSAAPSLRFAVPLRVPVQGSPSLANPFSGTIPVASPSSGVPDAICGRGWGHNRQKKTPPQMRRGFCIEAWTRYYIMSMPPMPPPGGWACSSFLGFSATEASVVINRPAMEAAF